MRQELLTNATLEARLQKIEKTLLSHDSALRDVIQKLRPLLLPPPDPLKPRIGSAFIARRTNHEATCHQGLRLGNVFSSARRRHSQGDAAESVRLDLEIANQALFVGKKSGRTGHEIKEHLHCFSVWK